MATVYIDRDNSVTLALTQDGSAPAANVITKAALWIPGGAFSDRTARVIDTDGSNMALTESATKVQLDFGTLSALSGSYLCYLTIYDSANPNGIAWDSLTIQFSNWPASV